ncbi:MAG: DUF2207 domain-containing protein, partial [bacterium]|nr:DUF2207 domain-containing protein [bacterium]
MMKNKFLFLVALFFFIITAVLPLTGQQEWIDHFSSEIWIKEDGSMDVIETIRVRCNQDQIQHGIYRDFPTRYKDRLGHSYHVAFQVLNVKRDNRTESYFTKDLSNGIRVYIGDKNYNLSPGDYTYQLSYHTDRQLGFFNDHDELYWNVTGNNWSFIILWADC